MFVIELFGSFYDLLFYFDQFDPEVQLFASHFMIGIEGDGRFFFCRHFAGNGCPNWFVRYTCCPASRFSEPGSCAISTVNTAFGSAAP